MSEDQVVNTEMYNTACSNCRELFDAIQAEWCNCLTTERSFVCPHCGKCFCQAPPAYKQKFWADAPKSLWDKKRELRITEFMPKPNPEPSEVKRPLVLIVEDEKEIQRVASQVIESLGYGMVLARNGLEGLLLARRYMPDLILSDALMPKMDGREMCRQLKEDSSTAKIKMVIMTSLYTGAIYKLEARKAFHVDDYMEKPLEFEKLSALLKKHLS